MADPTLPAALASQIDAFNKLMAQIDARRHAQNVPGVVAKKEEPVNENVGQVYFVAENREARVDDMRGTQHLPSIVIEDNKGWKDVGWEW